MGKLTKEQQRELDTLRRDVRIARALAWPNFEEPKPLPRPTPGSSETIHGFAFNLHCRSVSEHWQNVCGTYDHDPRAPGYRSGTQDKPPLYATPEDAWKAMYCEAARKFGQIMADMLDAAKEGKAGSVPGISFSLL